MKKWMRMAVLYMLYSDAESNHRLQQTSTNGRSLHIFCKSSPLCPTQGAGNKILSNMWLFDIDRRQFSEFLHWNYSKNRNIYVCSWSLEFKSRKKIMKQQESKNGGKEWNNKHVFFIFYEKKTLISVYRNLLQNNYWHDCDDYSFRIIGLRTIVPSIINIARRLRY